MRDCATSGHNCKYDSAMIVHLTGGAKPSITASFTTSANPVNAYFTDVTFTSTSTGSPLNPDTFIWTWAEDGVQQCYIGNTFTTKISAIGSVVMTLTAINSVNGASDTATVTVTSNAYLPIAPVLWLDAMRGITLNGATVSAWADQSGLGNHCSQATASKQGLYVTDYVNGKAAIYFNAAAFQDMTGNDLGLHASNFTIFLVCQNNNTTAGTYTMFRIGSGTTGWAYRNGANVWNVLNNNNTVTGRSVDSLYSCLEVLSYRKEVNVEVNLYKYDFLTTTSNVAASTAAMTTGGIYTIGSSAGAAGSFYTGWISEVIVVGSVVSPANTLAVQEYLIRKYL